MHTPVLYILSALPEMVQCTCTPPLLWCAPQVTSTNHRILATRYACRSGMHTCISCSDVHHVVYIYSTVHRQQQRTYIVYVHSTLHAVQYWSHIASEMAGSTTASMHPMEYGMCISVSLYLRRRCVYTSTLYHSMYTTGCSTGMYLHHCWYAM